MNQIKLTPINTGCCSSTPEKIEPNKELPIAIIGAGPIGLAAAAHLVNAGEHFIILEAGSTVGHHISSWEHVRLFSPWQYNVDKVAEKLLKKQGWIAPNPEHLPLGKELISSYLEPLAKIPEIKSSLSLNTKVVSISKKGLDKMKTADRSDVPFILYVEQAGQLKRLETRAVIDATGTWSSPNPINADNIWTNAEKDLKDHIYYGIPNVHGSALDKYKGKRVAVVGGGHSAINSILELAQLDDKVEIMWIMRKRNVEAAFGGEDKDALAARGELGSKVHQLVDAGKVRVFTPFLIHHLAKTKNGIIIEGESQGQVTTLPPVDEIIANTGSRPDFSLTREIRLDIDPVTESVTAIAPLIDPNIHSCGTVRPHGEEELRQPEKNYYIVGMKSYGRAPTFLMATGYEQVRSIVAYLTGDLVAAKKVELDLPETGVCSVNIQNPNSSCC